MSAWAAAFVARANTDRQHFQVP